MEATILNQESINAYKTLMINPKENGLDMPALKDCFEEGEGTPKHILFDQYIKKIQKPLPKVFFYIIMDEVYAEKITKCADGNIGYKLNIKNEAIKPVQQHILPVITLYQPWATWIARGWKTIETRTHSRFACLKGKTILIHAGMNVDKLAFNNEYLTKDQLNYKPEEMVNGFILGQAFVTDFLFLYPSSSHSALIECQTPRYGLFLENIVKFDKPIPAKGGMGIWYFDLISNTKMPKSIIKSS